jgi:hypothetical protein
MTPSRGMRRKAMVPWAFFGLGLPEIIILGLMGVGTIVAVVIVVVIVTKMNTPKGPTND